MTRVDSTPSCSKAAAVEIGCSRDLIAAFCQHGLGTGSTGRE